MIYFDPTWLVDRLQALVPSTVASVVALDAVQQADPANRVRQLPGLVVVAERTTVEGGRGLGNGRRLFERMALVTQIQDITGRDAGASLREIREATFDLLERWVPAADWAPMLYDGGQILAISDGVYSHIDYWITETATPTTPRVL